MTVSEWGSAAAPRAAPGFQQGRSAAMNTQAIHPAHGGPAPRDISAIYPQGVAAPRHDAGAGFPAPQAYGTVPHHGSDGARGRVPGNGPGSGQGGSTALNVIGALVSVALIVGLGVWGYKLAVRDVTGVPVVKALEGPMRIQPEDPGGAVAPHQGLAVNDVAADGVSAGPVDQLKLAPPVAQLDAEDVPARSDVEVGRAADSPSTAPLPPNGAEIDADAAVAEALGLTDIPGLDAPGLGTPDAGTPVSADPVDVIPESVPGVIRSPRPMPRPAGVAPLAEIAAPQRVVDVSAPAAASTPAPARPSANSATAPAVVLGNEVDPSEVDANARLVQLGAFPSADAAREGWKEVAALNPDLFQNRNWTIEQRTSGGTAFYRLRAIGFDGLQDARAFCAALVATQGICVPVVDTGSGTTLGAVTE